MFERLIERGAALAQAAARRRRTELANELRDEAPAGVRIEVEGESVVLAGRALGRRFARDPALRWLLVLRQAQDERRRRR